MSNVRNETPGAFRGALQRMARDIAPRKGLFFGVLFGWYVLCGLIGWALSWM
jgi:hypothetical protein